MLHKALSRPRANILQLLQTPKSSSSARTDIPCLWHSTTDTTVSQTHNALDKGHHRPTARKSSALTTSQQSHADRLIQTLDYIHPRTRSLAGMDDWRPATKHLKHKPMPLVTFGIFSMGKSSKPSPHSCHMLIALHSTLLDRCVDQER